MRGASPRSGADSWKGSGRGRAAPSGVVASSSPVNIGTRANDRWGRSEAFIRERDPGPRPCQGERNHRRHRAHSRKRPPSSQRPERTTGPLAAIPPAARMKPPSRRSWEPFGDPDAGSRSTGRHTGSAAGRRSGPRAGRPMMTVDDEADTAGRASPARTCAVRASRRVGHRLRKSYQSILIRLRRVDIDKPFNMRVSRTGQEG